MRPLSSTAIHPVMNFKQTNNQMAHYEATVRPPGFSSLFQKESWSLPTRRTSSRPRKDTSGVGSRLVDTGEFAVPVCDGVSDWPLQTCNIILHVSAASIGYTGPALHQAVALDGNIININTGNLKTNAPFSAACPPLY